MIFSLIKIVGFFNFFRIPCRYPFLFLYSTNQEKKVGLFNLTAKQSQDISNPLHSGRPAIFHSFSSDQDQLFCAVQFGPKLNTNIDLNLHTHLPPTNISILRLITRCDFGTRKFFQDRDFGSQISLPNILLKLNTFNVFRNVISLETSCLIFKSKYYSCSKNNNMFIGWSNDIAHR